VVFVLNKRIKNYILLFVLLVVLALLVDRMLHKWGYPEIGRSFGWPGALLVMFSLIYFLRKYKYIKIGKLSTLLNIHEVLAWAGSLLLLVHGGIHFSALLPWLAVFFLLISNFSGFVGKYLLEQASEELAQKQKIHREGDSELLIKSLEVKSMMRWRKIHRPLTAVFLALALAHVSTIYLF